MCHHNHHLFQNCSGYDVDRTLINFFLFSVILSSQSCQLSMGNKKWFLMNLMICWVIVFWRKFWQQLTYWWNRQLWLPWFSKPLSTPILQIPDLHYFQFNSPFEHIQSQTLLLSSSSWIRKSSHFLKSGLPQFGVLCIVSWGDHYNILEHRNTWLFPQLHWFEKKAKEQSPWIMQSRMVPNLFWLKISKYWSSCNS